MRNLSIAVVVSCLAFACAVHGSPKVHVEGPIFDFGSILEGYAVSHIFVVENLGDETLEIYRVAVSCGCTATDLPTNRLAPGESVELEVLVDTAGFGGRISKSVYLFTNDPEYADASSSNRPRYTLRVAGEVIRALSFHTSISDMNYLFYVLIDLREPEAYAESHLMGSMNIPAEELGDWLDRLPTDALILLYDQDGTEAKQAAMALGELGYPTAYYVLGGLDEWSRWNEAFFVESAGAFEPASREGATRLGCLDRTEDPHCADIAELRYLVYLLIDVRSPEVFAQGHLFGAINIPQDRLVEQLDKLPKDVLTIAYGQSNSASDTVVELLARSGFTQARSLLGGLDEWIRQFGDRYVTLPQ